MQPSGCYFICAFLSYDRFIQNREVLGYLYPIANQDLKNLSCFLYDKTAQMKYHPQSSVSTSVFQNYNYSLSAHAGDRSIYPIYQLPLFLVRRFGSESSRSILLDITFNEVLLSLSSHLCYYIRIIYAIKRTSFSSYIYALK